MNEKSEAATPMFPRGLATGTAFCDREAERAELGRRLETGVHTWLAAPRRYGKTSLLHQVLLDGRRRRRGPRLRGIVLDLLPTYDQTSLTRTLLQGVGEVTGAVVSPGRRRLEAAAEFLGGLRPKLTVGPGGPMLELTAGASAPETIVDALTGLDRIAVEAGTRVCMVCDEFQQIASLKEGPAVEAAIRHAAERAKRVTYLFSGSYRHLLEALFNDRSRPLYQLCESMTLARIEAGAYRDHLQRCARLRWNGDLGPEALERILGRTERHPHYVNALCARLWRHPRRPVVAGVDAEWGELVRSQRALVAGEIDRLSPTQRAVLFTLAERPARALTGREFVVRTRLAKSSLAQAVEALLRTARIRRDEEGLYTVLDPALAHYLRDPPVEIPG